MASPAGVIASLRDRGRIDWLLASFPKSGSTWVRFILANYLLQRAGIDEPCETFRQLNRFLPEFGRGAIRQRWRERSIAPVVVKTHWTFKPFFRGVPAVLVVRNPGDVMVSQFHYLTTQGLWHGDLTQLLRDRRRGVGAWAAHYRSWCARATAVIRYETLRGDTAATMAMALRALDVDVDLSALQTAIERSATERIRRIEQGGGSHAVDRQEDFAFVRNGSVAQWREQLDADDVRFVNDRVPAEFRLSP